MTSRERVQTALSHRPPDRIPRDYWATAEVTDLLCRHYGLPDKEALLRRLGIDLRYVAGPSYVGQALHAHEDGSVEDLWGVRRLPRTVTGAGYTWTYHHVVQSPLESARTAADIHAYDRWPSADWWDYSTLAGQCAACDGYAVVNAGDRLDRTAQLKPMMYLRGMEQTYLDLAMNPELATAIVGHIVDYFLAYNERVFAAVGGNSSASPLGARDQGGVSAKPTGTPPGDATCAANRGAGSPSASPTPRPDCTRALQAPGSQTPAGGAIDIFMMGDDFGTQQGPMMSVDTWRRFLKPGFAAFIELAHRHGLKVMHHTCGSVGALIPDFIACGLDILQSVQPQAAGMDLGKLRREFGRDLCFQGGLDIQGILPHGTPEQVRAHVRAQIEAAGYDGGYILCTAHNLQPDTPLDNLLALFDAYEEFGAPP